MNGPFDPYYTWLGIPPSEQPPNHYRLLTIQLFEANDEVIGNAADRVMMHLRSFQIGANSAESQRLLNEVSVARICLQDAARKAAYDADLRRLTTPAAPPVYIPTPAPRPAPPSVAAPALLSRSPVRSSAPSTRNTSFDIAKIVVVGIVGVAVAVMALQYATGVDLLGWSVKEKQEKDQISKVVAPTPPQKSAPASGGEPAAKSGPQTPTVPTVPPVAIPAPATTLPAKPPSPINAPPSREAYVFSGQELPKNVSIKIMFNKVHRNGLVTLEEESLPASGAWRIENQELLLTSIHGMKNTSLAVSSAAEHVQEIRVSARTTAAAPSSVRFVCGNVYVILNWEDQNQNQILVNGRRAAVTAPHCLVAGKWHDIALQQSADLVRVLVDGKEVISAKGSRLSRDVQIGSSHQGTIGVRSVEIVPEQAIAAVAVPSGPKNPLLGRYDIQYSNLVRREYLFDQDGTVSFLGQIERDQTGPIPPFPMPPKSRVFWQEENGDLAGYISWPNEGKVERIVVGKDNKLRFVLHLTSRVTTGDARSTDGGAEITSSTPEPTAAIGKFEIHYSNNTRREYLFEAGGKVTLLRATKTAGCGNCGNAIAGQPFVQGQCRYCWLALHDPKYAAYFRGTELQPPSVAPVSRIHWHHEDGQLIGYLYWANDWRIERVVVQNDGRMQFMLFFRIGRVDGKLRNDGR